MNTIAIFMDIFLKTQVKIKIKLRTKTQISRIFQTTPYKDTSRRYKVSLHCSHHLPLTRHFFMHFERKLKRGLKPQTFKLVLFTDLVISIDWYNYRNLVEAKLTTLERSTCHVSRKLKQVTYSIGTNRYLAYLSC